MSILSYTDLPERLIQQDPLPDLKLIVTIPCYAEENILPCLHSLNLAHKSDIPTEVILLLNEPENVDASIIQLNHQAYQQTLDYKSKNEKAIFRIFPIYVRAIPYKISGVGLARKIAMDEAARRFEMINHHRGLITGFDADSSCDGNYFSAIFDHFQSHPDSCGASIYFEHPLKGDQFSANHYKAICAYELHLRYFIQMQRCLRLPFAYQTIGSSMVTTASGYRKVGGMNKRKAGEDFYFIHKLIKLGGFTEIRNTRVIPSPRGSNRVPFGTGKAVLSMLHDKALQKSYAPQSFLDLREFMNAVDKFYSMQQLEIKEFIQLFPKQLSRFLTELSAAKIIFSIQENSKDPASFRKKFYQWFDAFKLMKYLHFAREHAYPGQDLDKIFSWYFPNVLGKPDPVELIERLHILRQVDKEGQSLPSM